MNNGYVSLENIRDYFQIIIRSYPFLFVTLQGSIFKFQCFAIVEPSFETIVFFQLDFYRIANG